MIKKWLKRIAVGALLVGLTACGGSNSFTASTPTTNTPGTSSSGNTTTNQYGTITLALLDSTNAVTTAISADSPATLAARVLDQNGQPVPGIVVTFASDTAGLVTFNPSTGTALTDPSGIATVQVIAGATTGAAMLSASAKVSGNSISAQTGFQVNAPNLKLGALTIGAPTISSYGTTSLSVSVLDGSNSPYTTAAVDVRFSSTCASSGKAVLAQTVKTVNGVATVSYSDNGCAAASASSVTDRVTVLLVGSSAASVTGNISINPSTAGSIRFISATPTTITLKGTGGVGLQETSKVVFKVVDGGGNPVGGKTVDFALSTTVGGITLSNASMLSDQVTGEVFAIVNSGKVSTPVRVIATVAGTELKTQSDQLSISTGIPAQDSVSLSASIHNIEGWQYDGVTTDLTMRMADHFRNPVPDGTSVVFTAEGGKIGSNCVTKNGECTVTLNSQNFRPSNGRVTVLAYAVGEEAFTDLNGDGVVSNNAERIDADSMSTDIPGEAFVDFNENGVRDANEPFIDFNTNGSYQGAGDGLYNGILCDPASGQCAANRTLHVRDKQIIVFSGSTARFEFGGTSQAITFSPPSPTAPDKSIDTITLPVCVNGVKFSPPSVSFWVKVYDERTNVMPANTSISASTGNGAFSSKTSHTVFDSSACHTPGLYGCPASATAMVAYNFSITSDATQNPETLQCSNPKASGQLTITVTTPKGIETPIQFNVTD